MRKPIDKRNRNRIKTVNFVIDYKVKGGTTVTSVEVINLSIGGMCFLRKSIILKNDVIQIKFPFKSRMMVLMGQVSRVDGREVAVKFLNSEEEMDKFIKIFNDEYPEIKKEKTSSNDTLLNENSISTHSKIKDDLKKIFDIE